ncbi:hypothetical protein ACSPAH_20720 [Buttiauxella agrestis]
MLSERQLSLLERLENQNLTMKELASGEMSPAELCCAISTT